MAASADVQLLSKYASGQELLRLLKPLPEQVQVTAIACASKLVDEVRLADNKENANPTGSAGPLHDAGPPLCRIENLNLLTPRGKFNMALHIEGMRFSNSKSEFHVSADSLGSVVILDSFPKDTKNKVLLFVELHKPAVLGKTKHHALLIQTSADAELSVPLTDGQVLSGQSAVVLCQVLGILGASTFVTPDPNTYKTSKGALCLDATHKVTPGHLFLLDSAVVFVERPALLVAHDTISWVELQRIDRPTSTFDVVLHRRGAGQAKLELGQIERAELPGLQAYLAAHQLRTSPEGAEAEPGLGKQLGGAAAGQAEGAEDDSDDEEEDFDFDPEGSQSGSDEGGEDETDEEEAVHTDDLSADDAEGGGGADKPAAGTSSNKVQPAPAGAGAPKAGAKRPAEEVEEEDIGDSDSEEEDEDEDEYETEGDDGSDDEGEVAEVPAAKRARQQ